MYLAGPAGFPSVPATVGATVARERWAATQQDVEDDPQTPQVAALVVEGRLICEHLHHFWSHVLRRATLQEREGIQLSLCASHWCVRAVSVKVLPVW